MVTNLLLVWVTKNWTVYDWEKIRGSFTKKLKAIEYWYQKRTFSKCYFTRTLTLRKKETFIRMSQPSSGIGSFSIESLIANSASSPRFGRFLGNNLMFMPTSAVPQSPVNISPEMALPFQHLMHHPYLSARAMLPANYFPARSHSFGPLQSWSGLHQLYSGKMAPVQSERMMSPSTSSESPTGSPSPVGVCHAKAADIIDNNRAPPRGMFHSSYWFKEIYIYINTFMFIFKDLKKNNFINFYYKILNALKNIKGHIS